MSLWLLVTDLLKSSEALEKKGFYHNWSVWITSVHMNHYETSLRQGRWKEWLLRSPCVDWGHLGFSLGCSVEMQIRKPEIVGIIGGGVKIYIFVDKMLLKRYWWKTMLEECTKIVLCCLQSKALLEKLKASHFAWFPDEFSSSRPSFFSVLPALFWYLLYAELPVTGWLFYV